MNGSATLKAINTNSREIRDMDTEQAKRRRLVGMERTNSVPSDAASAIMTPWNVRQNPTRNHTLATLF